MIIRNNRVITPTNERQIEAENLDVEIGNLESATDSLDAEIDKLPERNAGAYDVIQTINGDECHLSIKDAQTESYYANKMRAIIDGSVTELTEQDFGDITSINTYKFYNTLGLTTVRMPNSIITIDTSAFSCCINLISVIIPDSVTSIGIHAFDRCSSLTSITLSSSITSIENNVFTGCDSLTSITIPSSVTSIGRQAFSNCSSLTSIIIPNSVISIDRLAFSGCRALKKVVYEGQAPTINANTFSNCPVALYDFRNCTTVPQLYNAVSLGHATGCQIVVPDALYDEWQQATNWSSLTDVVWVKASEYTEEVV